MVGHVRARSAPCIEWEESTRDRGQGRHRGPRDIRRTVRRTASATCTAGWSLRSTRCFGIATSRLATRNDRTPHDPLFTAAHAALFHELHFRATVDRAEGRRIMSRSSRREMPLRRPTAFFVRLPPRTRPRDLRPRSRSRSRTRLTPGTGPAAPVRGGCCRFLAAMKQCPSVRRYIVPGSWMAPCGASIARRPSRSRCPTEGRVPGRLTTALRRRPQPESSPGSLANLTTRADPRGAPRGVVPDTMLPSSPTIIHAPTSTASMLNAQHVIGVLRFAVTVAVCTDAAERRPRPGGSHDPSPRSRPRPGYPRALGRRGSRPSGATPRRHCDRG